MKLALIFDGLQIGGIEQVGSDYAKLLQQLGYDVTIVNLNPVLNDMEKKFPQGCSWIKFRYPRGLSSERYAQLVKKGVLGTTCYLIASLVMPFLVSVMKFRFRMKMHPKEKFDIAIAFSGHFNDLDFVAKGFIKSRNRMCWLHGALYSYLLVSDGYLRLYDKIKNLVVLVDDAQEEVLTYNKEFDLNINKLYNPTFIRTKSINNGHVRSLKEKYGTFVLMVARFDYPHKDQYTVAKMLEVIRTKYGTKVDLVFVGAGPEEDNVRAFVKTFSSDIQKHIHFEGKRYDVQDYYKAAYVLVHASVAGEGLPTVMIEAMAYGLPMVVTDSKTGPREILGDNEYGLLCRIKDAENMAEKVNRLIVNPELYSFYAEKSKDRIKDFSPDAIKYQLEEVFTKLRRLTND